MKSATSDDISLHEFKKYRDIAPEYIDDESLKILILENNMDANLIATAISDIWNQGPSYINTWTSTSKTKTKGSGEVSQLSKGPSKSRDSKSQSSRPPKAATEKPKRESSVSQPKKEKAPVSEWTKEKSGVSKDFSIAPSTGKSAWSENLLNKLKHQDVPAIEQRTSEVQLGVSNEAPVSLFESIGQPLAVEPLSASTLLSLSHNSHVHNVVSLDMASTSVSDNIASVQELLKRLDVSDSEVSAGYGHSDVKAFEESRQLLNFGKWGSEETPDVVSFHFGSFETEDNASQSNSWNNMSGNDASMLSSQTWSNGGDLGLGGVAASTLFSNQQIKPMEQSSSDARFEHKATPPGLDSQIKPSVGAQSMAHTKAQNQVQSQMYSTATANHFQQAPPGIPLGATGRAIPTAPLTQGVIPQYYPPYDVSLNAQYTAPYNGNVGFSNNMSSLSSAVPSAVPITPAQTQAAPSSNQNSQSGIQPSQQQAQQIPQQQAFAPPPGMTAPYGFYPAPYFPNQAYYYSNQPNIGNYYGQNRNMYQNPRAAYQPDPYGGTGSVYQPDMYASTGQFDSSTYGAAPVHHSATPAGVTGNVPSTASNVPNGNANGNANANGSKQQKNNNSLPSGTGQVDNNNAYAYNNPYVVQARGSEQQAWSYPTVGQSWGNVNQGFSQTATPVGSVNNQQQAGSFSTSQPQSQPQHGQTNQPPRRW